MPQSRSARPARRPRRLPLLAALLAALLAGAAAATEIAGDRAVEEGDFALAVEAYGAALERIPDDVDLLVKYARATTYLAEYGADVDAEALYGVAAERARRAIAAHPESADAHFELARAIGRLAQFKGVLQSLGLADEMRAELDRALELDPDHAGALHALALWHLEVPWIAGGRSGRSRALFERAVEIEPNVVGHRVGFADALLRLGEPEAARAQLDAALALPARTFVDRSERSRAEALLADAF